VSWMDRSHLDDLRDEARDARDAELRKPSSHADGCRCRRCVVDEYTDTRGQE
jgi:hypothetical protein